MNMAGFYVRLSQEKKAVFWLLLIALVGFLLQTPLFFFYDLKGYSYPLGWLLGSAVEIVSYLSILRFSRAVSPQEGSSRGALSVALSSILRFLLYGIVLVISAFCTFHSDWLGGFDAFNFFTSFGGLFPLPFVLLALGFLKKGNAEIHSSEEVE